MTRQKSRSHDADLESLAGLGEGSDDDAVEQRLGSQQQPSLQSSGGDLDKGTALRDEAEEPWHRAQAGQCKCHLWVGGQVSKSQRLGQSASMQWRVTVSRD